VDKWSEFDSMRTVFPHVLVRHRGLDLAAVKQLAKDTHRFIDVGPSRQALYDAAGTLTSLDATTTFTPAQARVALADLGHEYALGTVKELLKDEAASPWGRLARARTGLYRLREGTGGAMPASAGGRVLDHVLTAMADLAASGEGVVTRAEVEVALEDRGTPYSQRAVLQGLLRARRAEPPLVRQTPDGRYTICQTPR
jgi:hypothetical protein